MNRVSNFLSNILKACIGIMIVVLTISSISFIENIQFHEFSNKLFLFLGVSIGAGVFIIYSKIRHKTKILLLLILAFILRIFWVVSVNTMPVSDFLNMYESASYLVQGNLDAFSGYNYLARFPHLVPMTLYMSLIIKLFPIYNIVVMKIINIVLGVLSIYLLYKLSDIFIKSEKNKLYILLLGGIFPAFISYSSVLCTENLAIPLYLITLIVFYKATQNKNSKIFFGAGVLLSISNLFRGVGIVFIIAIIIYIFMCEEDNKFKNTFYVLFGYILLAVLVSGALINFNVIKRPLWIGMENSNLTLLLKGTNVNSGGKWSVEDAEFVDKYLKSENFEKICINKILGRLEEMSFGELILFWSKKILSQWCIGDFSGTYWAFAGTNTPFLPFLPHTFQIIYILILAISIFSLFSKKNNLLIHLLLLGFGLLFMIIETQPRYSYVISWAILILAVEGIEELGVLLKKGKKNDKGNKIINLQ